MSKRHVHSVRDGENPRGSRRDFFGSTGVAGLLAISGGAPSFRLLLTRAHKTGLHSTSALEQRLAALAVGRHATADVRRSLPVYGEMMLALSNAEPAPSLQQSKAAVTVEHLEGIHRACEDQDGFVTAEDATLASQTLFGFAALAAGPTPQGIVLQSLALLSPYAVRALEEGDEALELGIFKQSMEKCFVQGLLKLDSSGHKLTDESYHNLPGSESLELDVDKMVKLRLPELEILGTVRDKSSQDKEKQVKRIALNSIEAIPRNRHQSRDSLSQGRDPERSQQKEKERITNELAKATKENNSTAKETAEKRLEKVRAAEREAAKTALSQFRYYQAEVQGAAQLGATALQAFGVSSLDAHKFANAVVQAGTGVLAVAMGPSIAMGPLAIAGAVAAGVVAIANLFSDDDSNRVLQALRDDIEKLSTQLGLVLHMQVDILKYQELILHLIDERTTDIQLTVKSIESELKALEKKFAENEIAEHLLAFRSKSNSYWRKASAEEKDVHVFLEVCLDHLTTTAHLPVCFAPPGKAITLGALADRHWNSEGTSPLPHPAVWREGVLSFLRAALDAVARGICSLNSIERFATRHNAGLVCHYDLGIQLRRACRAMTHPEKVRAEIEQMKELLGQSMPDGSIPSEPTGVKRVLFDAFLEQRSKNYPGYPREWESKRFHDLDWRTTGELYTYLEIRGQLWKFGGPGLDRGNPLNPINAAVARKLVRVESSKPEEKQFLLGKDGFLDKVVDLSCWSYTGILGKRRKDRIIAVNYNNAELGEIFTVEVAFHGAKGGTLPQDRMPKQRSTISEKVQGRLVLLSGHQLEYVLDSCAKLLWDDDRQRAQREVPDSFGRALQNSKTLYESVRKIGQRLNTRVAMAAWRSIPCLTVDYPLQASPCGIVCDAEGFQRLVSWAIASDASPGPGDYLTVQQKLLEHFNEQFYCAERLVEGLENVASVQVLDETLAALDTFLSAVGVEHESWLAV